MATNTNSQRFRKAASEIIRQQRSQFNTSDGTDIGTKTKIMQPMKSISQIISELQCSIKKLELKLRLVDGENIKEKDFEFSIFDIEQSCPNNITTKKFIAEMTKKREDNIEKAAEDLQKEADDEQTELFDFFNFYLPSISLFAAIAISYLSTTEITTENITKSTVIYNAFIINFLTTIKPYLENGTAYMDLFSKGLGLYPREINFIFDGITESTAPITTPLKVAISKKSKNFYNSMPLMLQKATDDIMSNFVSIFNSKKYSKITPKLIWALTMFCIAIYFIILFMYMTIDDHNANTSNTKKILFNITSNLRITKHDGHGGKMSKKSKKSKSQKIKKVKKVKKQTNL